MPKKANKDLVDQPFYFPEHQLTIQAPDLRAAQEKIPAAIKARKESEEASE